MWISLNLFLDNVTSKRQEVVCRDVFKRSLWRHGKSSERAFVTLSNCGCWMFSMGFLSGIYRRLDMFADVSGNRLPFSPHLKTTLSENHISQGKYWGGGGGVSFSVPLFSLGNTYSTERFNHLIKVIRSSSNHRSDLRVSLVYNFRNLCLKCSSCFNTAVLVLIKSCNRNNVKLSRC